MHLVFDTSFLLTAFQERVDPFEAVERVFTEGRVLAVLDKTIEELEKLIKEGKFSEKKAASLVLQLIKSKNLKIITSHSDGYADDALVALDPQQAVVATQDIGLKKRLKERGFKVITLRQRKYAVMV